MDLTAKNITPKEQLTQIRNPVQSDLKALDAFILKQLHSDIDLIRTITNHIVESGGKRLRPLVVILFARMAGYSENNEHLALATIIEFVHTATLLHDDVIDGSSMRRGQATANALHGNQASVLIGDFLYSRAFQILAKHAHVPIMQILANTTNAIAEGEVLQLMNMNDPDLDEAGYYRVIERKTAKLFESACEIGAVLATDDPTLQKAAATYGLEIGYAFQIIDDVLDYAASSQAMGKNTGDDLAEGKSTLPLIYTLKHADKSTQTIIRNAIETGSADNLDTIITAMHDCKAFDYCLAQANVHLNTAQQALAHFPDNTYRQSLLNLLTFVVNRNF